MRRLLLVSLCALIVGCGSHTTDHWLRQLKDPDVVKRRQAIRELGERTSEAGRVVPALAEALRDDSEYVRHDTATTLGKLGPEARPAVPELLAAAKDRQPNVRRAARAALKKVAPEAAGMAAGR
jgi:HEAT repeat protein